MTNEFTEEFLEELMKCCLTKKSFLETIIPYVKPNYFPDETYRKVWNEIVRIYKKERRLPSIGQLSLELKKDIKSLKLLGIIKRVKLPNYEDIISTLEKFIKESRFVEMYDSLGDIYNEGDKDKAYELFKTGSEQITNFSLKSSSYDKIFKDFNKRQFDRMVECTSKSKDKFLYGIDPLDDVTGGFQKGELTLFLGDSGIGKSQLLIHIGVTTARHGGRVSHIQAEGTRQQCLDRYDASWTGMLYKDVKNGSNIEKERMVEIKKTILKIAGEIYVESFEQFNSKSLADVRNILIDQIKLYGSIDVLILDYFELLNPGDGKKYTASEERFRQTSIGRGLKNLAVEFNIAVVTVTQASSIPPDMLNNPEFVITRYNLSEDRGKIRPVDNFITINQTKDERKARQVRLYCDKFREHDSGQTMSICQDLSRCRFYDRKRTSELQNFD